MTIDRVHPETNFNYGKQTERKHYQTWVNNMTLSHSEFRENWKSGFGNVSKENLETQNFNLFF